MRPEAGSGKSRGRGTRPSLRRPHLAGLALGGLVFWLLSVPSAHAQSIYEWREADGTVTYGQAPPNGVGAGSIRELRLPDAALPGRSAAVRLQTAAQPAGNADARSLRQADAKVALALASLQKAEQGLRSGQEPRPGERRHLVNGHSRLTQGYFDRIVGLEAAVAKARDALQSAYTERDTRAAR